jgi:hypothetical protein
MPSTSNGQVRKPIIRFVHPRQGYWNSKEGGRPRLSNDPEVFEGRVESGNGRPLLVDS